MHKVSGGSLVAKSLQTSFSTKSPSLDLKSKYKLVEHPSYEVIDNSFISEYGIYAILYSHKKTGAQLMSVINQDDNKVFGITFRTPPGDSTGVPHILEHSVLCGSRKFPVKEPFVDLLKGSLQNFLNAFTYPDRTCYPVASTNTKDFYNLVNVYVDAVLHPRAVKDPLVLEQEGWHYELEDPKDPLIFKGVVFNEMKGVYSSPDSLMGRATQHALFPDNIYNHDSGGDPLKIPDLTFDKFKEFHSNYYHPSNSRIFFYGNDDPMQRLVLMDEYLREFDRIPVTSQIKYQQKNLKPTRLEVPFPIGPGSEPKHMITLNWLVNDKQLDPKEALTLSLLDNLLLGTSTSVLRKTLMESKLGEAVTGGGLSDELLQNTFSIGLKGVQKENVKKVEELIFATMNKIGIEGFDKDDVKAAVNTLEFRLREFNTGSFPKGLSLMLGMLSNWIYDKPAFDGVRFEVPLEEIKSDIAAGKPIFTDLLKKYLTSNEHYVVVEMKPDESLEKKVLDEEEKVLKQVKDTLSPSDIEKIIQKTKVLKEAQMAEDSPEAKATLPRLSLSDIDKETAEIPIEVTQGPETDGVKVITHPIQTNGILYTDVVFDFSHLEDEDLALLPLFSRMLTEAGTSSLDEISLQRKIGSETGGIGASYMTDLKSNGNKLSKSEDVLLFLSLRGKAVADKIPVMMEIIGDIVNNVKLDNQKRAVEMLKESKSRKQSSVITSGHTFAATRLASKYSFLGYLGEKMGGITSVREAGALLEEAEKNWPKVLARLNKIRDTVIRKDAMIINLTADEATLTAAKSSVKGFIDSIAKQSKPLSTKDTLLSKWDGGRGKLTPHTFEGFTVPSQVNYVVKGGQMFTEKDSISGAYSVISRYLNTGYLWDNVRVLGGAYGGFSRFSENSGRFVYMSYRDPNLKKTLDIYDKTSSEMHGSEVSSEDILQGIIGTIGDIDSPQSPDQKGYTSFVQHLTSETKADRQRKRREILGTTDTDFKAFATKLEAVATEGSIVVVGSAAALEECNKALPEDKRLKIENAY